MRARIHYHEVRAPKGAVWVPPALAQPVYLADEIHYIDDSGDMIRAWFFGTWAYDTDDL